MFPSPPVATRTDTLLPYTTLFRSRFGVGVVDLAVLAGLAVDRTDVDDPAPSAFAHAGKAGLGRVETAAEVDAHHHVPVLEAHFVQHAVTGDAGIVDDDVDRADLDRKSTRLNSSH